ncbi:MULTISPECIES: AAA family ATPase [unclassified Streptomyces]|uniref:AAA family ATPase n=1 Tax=unclassified Streptomyces TaxID=2593676 RepID=UPI00116C5E49|nr:MULTISPECIES: AAA family ATPase [unclassified Streptomyces]MDI1454369.1 AAA family ATPase [Streptomyces sp. ATE26]GEK00610.1 hypothetical protein TNCT1_28860 [Streptomyces sp. 1-11]
MDAEFIQSVARVGSSIEIRLLTGDRFEGVLEELTLNRLALRQPNGMPVVVALASIAMATPAEPAPPSTAAALESSPPPHAPVAATTAVPTTETSAPPTVPSPGPASLPDPQLRAAAMTRIAELPVFPIDMDIYVEPGMRKHLEQIRNSYGHAEKVKELDPRFPRMTQIYSRALQLWNTDQRNPELTRLVGALAVAKGDAETAHRYLTLAVDLGDVAALRLMAVTSARLEDFETTRYALLQLFRSATPTSDPEAWTALLALLDADGDRRRLGELLGPETNDESAAAIRAALNGVVPEQAPTPRPSGAVPAVAAFRVASRLPKVEPGPATATTAAPSRRSEAGLSSRSSWQRGNDKTAYQRAKYLEHRVKDLRGAKAAYRQAIKQDKNKRESAVKDLAWLIRRMDGPEAALRVIEQEFPGMIQPGHALDNILIDFLTGAKRYSEALELLDRQVKRTDLTSGKRYHLLHQIAYVKLANGEDSVPDWERALEQSPHNQAYQRGLALALIQRGALEDLDEAERLIVHHADHRTEEILRRIAELREGGGTDVESREWVEQFLQDAQAPMVSTPPLIAYVLQNYSDLADEARQRWKRGGKPTRGDLNVISDLNVIAETARQMSGKQPETSARAYISASVLAQDLGHADVHRYLYFGLTTLADIAMDRKERESAQDLYRAALTAADERDSGERAIELRTALIGYLRTHGQRAPLVKHRDREEAFPSADEVARVLVEEQHRNPSEFFSLLPPLVAETSAARDLVLDAVCASKELLTSAAKHLGIQEGFNQQPLARKRELVRNAWQVAGDRWLRSRRQLENSLAELQHLSMSEGALGSALERLPNAVEPVPDSLHDGLASIQDALFELRRSINERSFEERENCLRQAGSAVRSVRAQIAKVPTSLAVALVEPIALRLQDLINETQNDLVATLPPLPTLNLALEESSTGQNGAVTVQIKVGNTSGRAPLESPELAITSDPEWFSVDEPRIQLPNAVRGGDHRIEAVKLRVTERGVTVGAFSLPVTLRYRHRSSGNDYVAFDATLPVRLAREEEFVKIVNPFAAGATGRPVADRNMFYGRDDLIDRIRSALRETSSPGVGVAIFGQKRAGKSSIRLHLRERLEQEDGLPVVDVGNIGDLSPESDDLTGTRLLALLMWDILDGANKALPPHGVFSDDREPLLPRELDREAFLRSPAPVRDCARLIEAHRLRTPGPQPPLIVLLDEFQYIDQWIRDGLLSKSFMQTFKALIEKRLFHLVIVGQAALDRLIQGDPNVFGVFSTERVTYLAKQDARQLIEVPVMIKEGDRKRSRYSGRAVDRIIELTGGSAFYIQRFCSQLVHYMNAERAPVVTEADVEHVRDEFLGTLAATDFDNLESPGYTDPDAFTSAQYQQVLLAVARASRHQPATLEAIQGTYQGPSALLQELLDDLVLRDVVRRESGGHLIVVRLYQDWLLKYYGATSGASGS